MDSSASNAWAMAARAVDTLNIPAAAPVFSLSTSRWGAESEPKKKRGSPETAAWRMARRSVSWYRKLYRDLSGNFEEIARLHQELAP